MKSEATVAGRVLMLVLALLAPGMLRAGPNEWTNVGPEGGSVQYLAVDPQVPTTVYAATSVGVFKSQDAGASWNNTGLSGVYVGGLVIDRQAPTTLYAWTRGSSTHIFKSTDGAATWNQVDSGLPANCCFVVLFDPQDTGTMYAVAGAPQRDLFKSTDGGASWALTSGLPNKLYFIGLATDPQTPGSLYAAAIGADSAGNNISAVLKSTDGGASWTEANSGLPGPGMFPDQFALGGPFAIDPKNPGTVYLSKVGSGVYKSTNGGASWRPANSGMPSNPPDFRSCCVAAVVIDPQNSNTLYVPSLNGVIFKSTNGGASWTALGSALLPPPFTLSLGPGSDVLAIDPQNTSTLYSATQIGLSKSTDGGSTWHMASLRAMPISSLAINPQTSSFIYAGNLLSLDAGKSWFALTGLQFGIVLAIDPLTPTTVYGGRTTDGDSCTGSIFKSLDGGQNWTDTRGGRGCLSTMVIDPQSPSTIYAASSGGGSVYKSVDGGTSWSVLNSGLPSGFTASVSALAIDPRNTSTVYEGGPGGVFKSTDGGANWSAVNSGLSTLSVNALAVDLQNTGTVYAGTGAGVFKSTNGGASWRSLLPSSSASVNVLVIHPQTPSTIYAGTETGLIRSTDGGERWTRISGGPGSIGVLAVDPEYPNTVYAGGPGGLFTITFESKSLLPRARR